MDSECWFKRTAGGAARTRQAAGLMNIVKPRERLEVRENFFSVTTVDSWNNLPEEIKMACSALERLFHAP